MTEVTELSESDRDMLERAAFVAKILGDELPDAPTGYFWNSEGELVEIPEFYDDTEYKYVLGLDPGGTTGVAMLKYTDDTLPQLVYLHQIEDGLGGYVEYFHGSEISENTHVASEKWVEHDKKGVDRTPFIIEGAQAAQWWMFADRLTYQTPEMKSLIPDEFLKEQNLWTEGKRHQMDGLIHALVWLRNHGHKPTIEALYGEQEAGERKIAAPGEAKDKEMSEEVQSAMEALAEAMKQMGDAAQEMADALAEVGQLDGDSEGEAAGSAGGDSKEHGEHELPPEVEVKGEREKITKNGVFAGYQPDEAERAETKELFDGKL